jgi:hypothetical protein
MSLQVVMKLVTFSLVLINFYSCGGKKYLITDKLNKPKLNEMKPLATNGGAMCPVGITAHRPIKLHLN